MEAGRDENIHCSWSIRDDSTESKIGYDRIDSPLVQRETDDAAKLPWRRKGLPRDLAEVHRSMNAEFTKVMVQASCDVRC